MSTITNLGIRLTADASAARREFAGFKSVVDDLKRSVGSRSLLKDTLEIVRGGGTVAGVVMFARTMQDVAEKANDMAEQVRRGQISVRDLIGETARSIPILGDLARAFDEIGSGGERRALKQVTDLVDAMKSATEVSRSASEELKRSGMSELSQNVYDIQRATDKKVKVLIEQERVAAELAQLQKRMSHKLPMTRQLEDSGVIEKRDIPIPEFTAARDIQSAVRDIRAAGFNREMKLIADSVADAHKELDEFFGTIDSELRDNKRHFSRLADEAGRAADDSIRDNLSELEELGREIRDIDQYLKRSGQERLDALAARGQAMRDSLRNPMELFRDELNEINDLVSSGELNWQQYELAVKRATEVRDAALRADAERRVGSDPGDAPSALAGSRAALDIIHRVQSQDAREERIKALIEETKRQTRLLERIAGHQERAEPLGNLN